MMKEKIKTRSHPDNLLPATLEQLNAIAIQVQEQYLSAREKEHTAKISSFISIQETCLNDLEKLVRTDSQATALWQQLEKTIDELLQATASLQDINETYSASGFYQEWQTQFHEALADTPEFVKIVISKTYWDVKPEDSFRIRLWKGLKKKQIWFVETGSNVTNRIRNLFKQPSLPAHGLNRSISVHTFFRYHYELPLAEYFIQAWQKFLQQVAIQIDELHESSEVAIDELLFLQDMTDICLGDNTADLLIPKLQKIKKQLPDRRPLLETMDRFKTETQGQLETQIHKLHEGITLDWEYAGTYILPNKEFDEKKIKAVWTRIEQKLDAYKVGWGKHFEGEKADWNKDLELAHLQVRVTQICFETLDSLNNKINNQIRPAFEEPLQMLSNSLEKFQEIGMDEEARLESEIPIENRLMLRSLQREKLPHIVDTLQQAQLPKALANYLSRIKNAVENLPDRHNIYSIKDLQNLPPESGFVDIELKDLVVEEIYSELANRYQTFTDDIQQKLDKVARDISEIDQIIQFNLEAALELLQQGEEKKSLDRALDVVIEGLERVLNQLNSLVQQNQTILELSQETLLQNTVEFEKNIQELGDNDKIFDLKLRVAKAKAREEMRAYRKKALGTIKSTLPFLLNYLGANVKKVHGHYLRLRRISGLAPVTTDVEGNHSLFIGRTQKRISTLPYVYKRLFRVQPLSDERFFEGREVDFEIIKQEFDSWHAGQFGATALVGEKGSGKTTLMNFATQQVYDKFPIVRIELSGSTISTEESLFLLLKEVFQEEEATNLDELESNIISMKNQKIVIAEDIQNLFLRTVDSFAALERFLLFMSRTQSNIYWVVTCTLYSWRYLDEMMNISKFFQSVVFLGEFTKENVQNIILKRHRVSGYKLLFEVPEDIAHSKKFKKLTTHESRQEFLKDNYFDQLNGLAGGNISVTMMYWLSAIHRIEQDTIIILADMDLDFSFLHQLRDEELFTLAALMQHEIMTIEEHAKVFHQDVRQSRLLLNRMTNRGILYEKSNDNYQINFLLYRAVTRTLIVKNILY